MSKKLLKEKGIKVLFPIQYLTFDHIYDGKNVIGQASKCSISVWVELFLTSGVCPCWLLALCCTCVARVTVVVLCVCVHGVHV